MMALGPHHFPSKIVLAAVLMCVLAGQGCARNDGPSEFGLLPVGQSVVFAAPAGKSIPAGTASGGLGAVPEPVGFRFRKVGGADEEPVYLDLVGAVDQSVRIFAARPGIYRLVEAYLVARPRETRWVFAESPNVLEVRDGEAVYAGTLIWRDTWVEVVNDEPEARAVYQKRLGEFQDRSLAFVTRMVSGTEFSR